MSKSTPIGLQIWEIWEISYYHKILEIYWDILRCEKIWCGDFFKVTRSGDTIGVQLQMIQYVFHIKTLSRDTRSFQGQYWLKNKRGHEVEIRCNMSITK